MPNTDRPSSSDNIIDVRNLLEYYKELREETGELRVKNDSNIELTSEEWEQIEDWTAIDDLIDELRGNGGDEQFEGDWFPLTLIAEDHFEDYARELADDIGAVDSDAKWPMNCIDWSQAADELKQDYTTVDFEGVTYYYR